MARPARAALLLSVPVLLGLSLFALGPDAGEEDPATGPGVPRTTAGATPAPRQDPGAAPATTPAQPPGEQAPLPTRSPSGTTAGAPEVLTDPRVSAADRHRELLRLVREGSLTDALPSILAILAEAPGGRLEAEAFRLLAAAFPGSGLEPAKVQALALQALERTAESELALAARKVLDALGAQHLDPAALEAAYARVNLPEGRLVLVQALALSLAEGERLRFLEGTLQRDAAPAVRAEALRQLARADPTRALALAGDALLDPDLREAAVRVLAQLRTEQADLLLSQAFQQEQDPRLRRILAETQVMRLPHARLRVDALGSGVQAAALTDALGRAGAPAHQAILGDVLASGASEEARVSALRALARGGRLPAGELERLAREDPSPRLREVAAELQASPDPRERAREAARRIARERQAQ